MENHSINDYRPGVINLNQFSPNYYRYLSAKNFEGSIEEIALKFISKLSAV